MDGRRTKRERREMKIAGGESARGCLSGLLPDVSQSRISATTTPYVAGVAVAGSVLFFYPASERTRARARARVRFSDR